jgi:hypothetical protein
MRVYYWSNTKFADLLRGLFGITPQPTAATFEGWSKYEQTAKSTSKFGYKIVEALDALQNVWMFIPDMIKSISYYFSNIKNQSHVLRTRTKRGGWGDLVSKIPDALMFSVIDFVEEECFWMNILCNEVEPKDPNAELLNKYREQSYIRRKLFPIRVPDYIRAKHGFDWLDFQINSRETTRRGKERHPYQKIKAAYMFAKYRFETFDAYKESGLSELYEDGSLFASQTPERSRAYATMTALELQFEKELTKHCNNIVTYRDYLWT